jgi:hypothetical protein
MNKPITDQQAQANLSHCEKGFTKLLTLEEANAKGMETLDSASTEKIAVVCGGIAERFNDYLVVTTPKEIDDMVNEAEELSVKEQKMNWVLLLRSLTQYTNEELERHERDRTPEWSDWCNDAVLFFAYNAVVFKKGIPAINNLTPEQKAGAARTRPRDANRGWCVYEGA